ncbi:hypothetical protein [Thermoleptolyngbya sp.]
MGITKRSPLSFFLDHIFCWPGGSKTGIRTKLHNPATSGASACPEGGFKGMMNRVMCQPSE